MKGLINELEARRQIRAKDEWGFPQSPSKRKVPGWEPLPYYELGHVVLSGVIAEELDRYIKLFELTPSRRTLEERVEQLTRENADLKKKVEHLAALEIKVEKLAQEIQAQRGEQACPEIVVSDPYFAWCNTHRDLLAQYPNQVVAIDINRSEIVAHGDTFAEKLRNFPEEYRLQLYVIHTADYS